jgi:hypothetical protein
MKDMIYSKEVGSILGYHEQTINTWRKQGGKLPPHSHTGGQFMWRRADIERFAGLWPRDMEEFNKLAQ